jgi:hypothetical protein
MKCFLNVIYADTRVADPDGHEFPDTAAARREAILSAREIVADRLRHGDPVIFGRFEIADAAGQLLDNVTFKEALESPERFERRPRIYRAPAPLALGSSARNTPGDQAAGT